MASVAVRRPHIRIEAQKVFSIDFRELWVYRELMFFLVWRDLKVRYKQTILGISWAVIQPVTQTVIFTLILNKGAKIATGFTDLPYPVFAFVGLLPWTYFATCLGSSSGSIVGSANLVTKVYFPRLIVPLASIITPVVDFLLGFLVLIALLGYYGIAPNWHAIAIPFFLLSALLVALGAGLWLAALNVRYRDVRYIVPFLTSVWFFLTPVVYPPTFLGKYQWLLDFNPMTGVVEGFRWAVLGRGLPDYTTFAVSFGVGVLLTVLGLIYFRRTERYFADII